MMGERDLARPDAAARRRPAPPSRRSDAARGTAAGRSARPPASSPATEVHHRDLEQLARRQRRQDRGQRGSPASTCRRRAGRSSAGCGRRRRRSRARAAPSPGRGCRRGRASTGGSRISAGTGRASTCVPLKWLASAIRRARRQDIDVAAGPGRLRTRRPPGRSGRWPSALAPIAAGSTPATAVMRAVERRARRAPDSRRARSAGSAPIAAISAERDRQVVMAAFLGQVGRARD